MKSQKEVEELRDFLKQSFELAITHSEKETLNFAVDCLNFIIDDKKEV